MKLLKVIILGAFTLAVIGCGGGGGSDVGCNRIKEYKVSYINPDTNQEGGSIVGEFNYNSDNKLEKIAQEFNLDKKSSKTDIEFFYSKGKIVKIVEKEEIRDKIETETSEFEYQNDKIAKKVVKEEDADGSKFEYAEIYSYDNSGNIVQVDYDEDNDGTIDSYTKYTYDNKNRLIKEEEDYGMVTNYTYNDKGYLIEKKDNYYTHKYEYNDKGDITKKLIVSNSDSSDKSVTEYKISYNKDNLVEKVEESRDGRLRIHYIKWTKLPGCTKKVKSILQVDPKPNPIDYDL